MYDEKKYDPQAVDIWSLAIIYCCMTLRRFPWKLPRLSDNSFKLFAADPTPGHDPKKLILPHSVSMTALNDTPARDFDPQAIRKEAEKKPEPPEDPHAKSEKPAPTTQDGTTATPSTQPHPPSTAADKPAAAPTTEKKEVIRGPWRILRLLPRESRHVIGRMLELDPKKRAKMHEILDDAWVANSVICRQMEGGHVVNAEDHTHVLEPPGNSPVSK